MRVLQFPTLNESAFYGLIDQVRDFDKDYEKLRQAESELFDCLFPVVRWFAIPRTVSAWYDEDQVVVDSIFLFMRNYVSDNRFRFLSGGHIVSIICKIVSNKQRMEFRKWHSKRRSCCKHKGQSSPLLRLELASCYPIAKYYDPVDVNQQIEEIEKCQNLIVEISHKKILNLRIVGYTQKEISLILEIGIDEDHVHFLIQTIPNIRFSDLVKKIKSITARVIFAQHPEVKTKLWGGHFWTEGYYISTVGQHGSEDTIRQYVKQQGNEQEYQQLHHQQLRLFD